MMAMMAVISRSIALGIGLVVRIVGRSSWQTYATLLMLDGFEKSEHKTEA